MSSGDRIDIRLFSELMKRLAAAECMQWNTRRQPHGVEDWLTIASEDTGSMFETCACLALTLSRAPLYPLATRWSRLLAAVADSIFAKFGSGRTLELGRSGRTMM
jgi:hypothetical protein